MPETDYVIKEIKLVQEGVFDFKEVYNVVKGWFNLHKYDVFEKNYRETQRQDDTKEIKIEFDSEKKIDQYIKYLINVDIKINDHKIVQGPKGKRLVQGTLTIEIEAMLQSDFDAAWEGRPLAKFTRGLYDKFVRGDKYEEYKKELHDQGYELYNELKAYLNLHKF